MRATVNGEGVELPAGASMADALAAHYRGTALPEGGVAAALNDELVPRADWPRRPLDEGDRILVVQAAQGG